MEYRTKVTILSAVFGVLCLTAVLGLVFNQTAVVQRQAQEPLVAFQPADVVSIDLGNTLLLTKTAKIWNLSFQGKPFPASSERIDTWLQSVSRLSRERLVTEGADVKAFGLDQGFKSVKLLGSGSKVLADLQIGGTNQQGDKTYVRLAGQKQVWQTDRAFARSLDLDFNTWADRALFPGRKADSLIRVSFDSRIEVSKTVYTPFDLVKATKDGKSVWQDRTKASTEAMTSWAAQVPLFQFTAFVSPSEAPAAATVLGTLTLGWSDGNQTTIKIGPPDAQSRYRCSDGTREFYVSDWALAQLLYR